MDDSGYTIINTKDGSTTIYLNKLDETYHSRHGALQESEHVFILNGLDRMIKNEINILEVGMGTGLNVLLTLANQNDRIVHYTALEPHPLPQTIIEQLQFQGTGKERIEDFNHWMKKIHNPSETPFANDFTLEVLRDEILNFSPQRKYDLIYFDAFAPNKQPEMWGENVFSKLHGLMSHGALLTTYCAQGNFKRTLKGCGFDVQSIPGPPGKREMTLAYKKV